MHKRSFSSILLASVCALNGCGATPSPSGPGQVGAGPHNGVIVPVGTVGVAEILNEFKTKNTTKRGHPSMVIAVYFLQDDRKTALATTPTEVSVRLDSETEPVTIALAPAPEPKDAAGKTRFASPVGAYDLSGLQGELTAKVGGETITQAFQGPR